jgi:ABC-type Fe3+-siderophore transport system permease subunit
MSSEIKRTAGVTAVATVGLVLCLTAGEVFDASWLFIPAIGFLFAAFAPYTIAFYGARGAAIVFVFIACILLAGLLAKTLG